MNYSESRGIPPFDWLTYLRTVEHGSESLNQKTQDAAQWVTCACGNQCAIIPREDDGDGEEGAPKDRALKQLGVIFFRQVRQMRDTNNTRNFEEYRKFAIEALGDIEKRAAIIIEKEQADAERYIF